MPINNSVQSQMGNMMILLEYHIEHKTRKLYFLPLHHWISMFFFLPLQPCAMTINKEFWKEKKI